MCSSDLTASSPGAIGVPDRHEPDSGEVNFPYLFELIDALGYAGWIGCEYHPKRGNEPGGTSAGLEWLRRAGGPTLSTRAQARR